MKKREKYRPDRKAFQDEMEKLMSSEKIQMMQGYKQHHGNNTLQHVRNVAYNSFALAEKLGWPIDERTLARGAVLHDYYLYDIKEQGLTPYRHGTRHPKKALANAKKEWTLSRKEENIIVSHMWPLTLFHPPRSREAVLICLADKYCAANEMILHRKNLEGR